MPNFGDIAANQDYSALFAPASGIAKSAIAGAPAGNLVGDADVQTLTNKRVNPRTATAANQASITPNGDTTDIFYVTGQAQALTINAPTGTPVEGQTLMIRIIDSGVAQTLTFNSAYQGSVTLALPTSSEGSTTTSMILDFQWDSSVSKWRLVRINK